MKSIQNFGIKESSLNKVKEFSVYDKNPPHNFGGEFYKLFVKNQIDGFKYVEGNVYFHEKSNKYWSFIPFQYGDFHEFHQVELKKCWVKI